MPAPTERTRAMVTSVKATIRLRVPSLLQHLAQEEGRLAQRYQHCPEITLPIKRYVNFYFYDYYQLVLTQDKTWAKTDKT